MTRIEAREQTFILVFEKSFSDNTELEVLEAAEECRNLDINNEFVKNVFCGVYSNIEEIDNIIAENLSGWKIDRISKVSLALLRLAIYEIKFCDDIPEGASINEAVELCKKYSTTDDAAFINGVLGTVVRK